MRDTPRLDKLKKLRKDCKVENSPHRSDIERRYLTWEPLREIASDYTGISHQAIQSFAIRNNLDEKRRQNKKSILHSIIERGMSSHIPVDSKVVIEAVRLLSKLDGELQEGARQTVNVGLPLPTQSEFDERMRRSCEIRGREIGLLNVRPRKESNDKVVRLY